MIVASDGLRYVVKFRENPQGDRVCFNECFAHLLARTLGLPVPDATAIYLAEDFILKNRLVWFEGAQGWTGLPSPGLHFGTLMVESRGRLVTEVLPQAWQPRVSNRPDFLNVLILDVWANHVDHRQAIFAENTSGGFDATFIDNGHMFGGPSHEPWDRAASSTFLNRTIYADQLGNPGMARVASKILSWSLDDLRAIAENVPEVWIDGGLEATLYALVGRTPLVEQIYKKLNSNLAVYSSDMLNWHDGRPERSIRLHSDRLRIAV
jgi:hypothetical protein